MTHTNRAPSCRDSSRATQHPTLLLANAQVACWLALATSHPPNKSPNNDPTLRLVLKSNPWSSVGVLLGQHPTRAAASTCFQITTCVCANGVVGCWVHSWRGDAPQPLRKNLAKLHLTRGPKSGGAGQRQVPTGQPHLSPAKGSDANRPDHAGPSAPRLDHLATCQGQDSIERGPAVTDYPAEGECSQLPEQERGIGRLQRIRLSRLTGA